jgi:hypothetical protein
VDFQIWIGILTSVWLSGPTKIIKKLNNLITSQHHQTTLYTALDHIPCRLLLDIWRYGPCPLSGFIKFIHAGHVLSFEFEVLLASSQISLATKKNLMTSVSSVSRTKERLNLWQNAYIWATCIAAIHFTAMWFFLIPRVASKCKIHVLL